MSNNYKERSKDDKDQKGGKSFRKNSYKGKNRSNETPEGKDYEKADTSGFNSPEWYAANTQLLADAASLPFSEPVGTTYDLLHEDYPAFGSTLTTIPGVMAIKCLPSVGISTDGTSAVNIAARNIYSYVRHANAGHSNYNSPDLMIYLLAMDNLYSIYSYMVRAYGVMRTYSVRNRYLPKALLHGMKLDPDDFYAHISDFRYFLNACAVRIGSLCAPNSMSYFLRHIWMYQNVYSDAPSSKSQLYMYVPGGFWKYEPVVSTTGGKLTLQKVGNVDDSNWTFEQLKAFVTDMIEAVIVDEDMNIMSGDILKAFGDSGIFKLSTIPEDYAVTPVFNMEVLTQINNTTLLGIVKDTTGDVTQADDVILYNPTLINFCKGLKGKRMLTLPTDVPTPGLNMVASRLMAIAITETGDPESYECDSVIDSLGSDFATEAVMLSFGDAGQLWEYPFHYATPISMELPSGIYAQLASYEKFNMHPALRLMFQSGPDAYSYGGEFVDVDNYTVIDRYELKKMHDTALLSEFAVPLMGAFGRKDSSRK